MMLLASSAGFELDERIDVFAVFGGFDQGAGVGPRRWCGRAFA
jgi:hypothetical protein